MKKIASIVIATLCALCLVGCEKKTYELPWDHCCHSIQNASTVELSGEDRTYVVDVLNDGAWEEKTPNCVFDYIFYLKKQEVRYHSACGTFYDCTNQKSMTASHEERTKINTALGV